MSPDRFRHLISRSARTLLRRAGYEVVATSNQSIERFPRDIDENAKRLFRTVKPYTMTSMERVVALRDAVRYVSRAGIEGAIVECGVWRGGSMLAAAMTLVELKETDRDLYLFDTFTRPPDPEPRDRDLVVEDLRASLDAALADPAYSYLPMDEVRALIAGSGYPHEQIHLVEGLVEETLPEHAPEAVALLRLDTDLYRSTAHEMKHLYPRLAPGGVLIVDDYGRFTGARDAVDEYFAESGETVLLNRIDWTGRLAIKGLSGAR